MPPFTWILWDLPAGEPDSDEDYVYAAALQAAKLDG